MRPLRAGETSEEPRRSAFIYLPNGVNMHDWEMSDAGPDYKLSRVLSPLEKHRANITPVSGLHHPNAFGIAHNATQTWLTGAPHGPSDRNTISVDQLIAKGAGTKTRFPSLELSNQGFPMAVSADGIALPAERNPAVVFQQLFAEPTGGIDSQRRKLQRKQSMLDLVLDDARTLTKKVSQKDRGRLDQYLTSVRDVKSARSAPRSGWRRRDPRSMLTLRLKGEEETIPPPTEMVRKDLPLRQAVDSNWTMLNARLALH